MENNKKNFWKGALAGALAMFMVGAAALGIMNVAGVDPWNQSGKGCKCAGREKIE